MPTIVPLHKRPISTTGTMAELRLIPDQDFQTLLSQIFQCFWPNKSSDSQAPNQGIYTISSAQLEQKIDTPIRNEQAVKLLGDTFCQTFKLSPTNQLSFTIWRLPTEISLPKSPNKKIPKTRLALQFSKLAPFSIKLTLPSHNLLTFTWNHRGLVHMEKQWTDEQHVKVANIEVMVPV